MFLPLQNPAAATLSSFLFFHKSFHSSHRPRVRFFFFFSLQLVKKERKKKEAGGFLQKLDPQPFLPSYQRVTSAAAPCSIYAAGVSRDVYCERVNRLCCRFRGRGLRQRKPPLSERADEVRCRPDVSA